MSLILALAVAAAGCSVSEPLRLAQVGQRAHAISGGSEHTGHPSVGLLQLSDGGQCTATLIGLKTIVTAAHCLKSEAYSFELDNGEIIPATGWTGHPDFQGDNTPFDIAVLRLARAPQVRPSIAATKPPTQGLAIVLVGFGVTYCVSNQDGTLSCTDDAGVKRVGNNNIATVNDIEFTFLGDASTCKGDSGGPAFATVDGREVQIGVTSRGKMPCGSEGIDTRIDAFLDWISSVAEGDVNTGKAPEVSISEPAADATLDSGRLTVKASITDDSGTVAKAELLVDGEVAATATTSPYAFSVDVEAGPHELAVVAVDGDGIRGEATVTVTVEGASDDGPDDGDPAPGTFGAECKDPKDCNSGMCAEDKNVGRSYCTKPCDPVAEGSCPGTGQCMPAGKDVHVCALMLEADEGDLAQGQALVGGCSISAPAADDSTLLLMLLGLCLAARGRRRR